MAVSLVLWIEWDCLSSRPELRCCAVMDVGSVQRRAYGLLLPGLPEV